MKRFSKCAVAVALGINMLVVAPATPAGAAPPTTFNDPNPPAIPPGAQSSFSAQCAGDTTGDATVSLDGPGANDVAATAMPLNQNGSNGVVHVDLGGVDSFGGVSTDAVGSYVFTVSCPSGGGTTDFTIEVMTPTFDLTAGASADECATFEADAMIPMGTDVDICHEFTNPLGEIVGTDGRVLAVHETADGGGISFMYPGWSNHPPLPAGGDYDVTTHGGSNYEPTTRDVFVMIEDAADNRAVSNIVRITVTPTPAIGVTVTSGLSAATACPENGGQETRTVEAGTDVYFCYSAQMLSDLDADNHTIDSDVQGQVANAEPTLLSGLGDTFEFGVAAPVTIDTTTVNTATWSALEATSDNAGTPLGGMGVGTVNVTGETTTTEATTNGATASSEQSPAATPVTAAPGFTG